MRPRTEIAAAQVKAVRRAMRLAPNKSVFQRLQCLWLRAKEDLSTEAIAQTVGLSVSHVRRVWSDFLRGGLAAARGRPKGGRRHQHLTPEQEQALLAPFAQQAQVGQLVTAGAVHRRYQVLVGQRVPHSTVYRLLARQGWRQLQSRPKLLKDNPRARVAFKKTPGQGACRGRWVPPPTATANTLRTKLASSE